MSLRQHKQSIHVKTRKFHLFALIWLNKTKRFISSQRVDRPVELDGEAEVGDAAGAVLLDQDVLALQVPVGDGRFALRAVDLRVEVAEAAGRRVRQAQEGLRVQRGQLQVVVQRAALMEVGDEEELREGACSFDVSRDEACRGGGDSQVRSPLISCCKIRYRLVFYSEQRQGNKLCVKIKGQWRTQDVLVSHQDGLVDLRLSEPAGFLSGEEDFDGHLLSSPAAQPHLAVPTFADLTHHLDLLGDRPLHLRDEGRTEVWLRPN